MRIKLLLIAIISLNTFFGRSQNDSTPVLGRIEFQFYPLALVYNRGISYCQELSGSVFSKNGKLEFNAGAQGALLRKLDSRYRQFDAPVEFPKFSSIDVNFGYKLFSRNSQDSGLKHEKLIIQGGYNLLKFGTNSYDYWIRDSFPDKGFERVNGVITHALMLGFKLHFVKTDTRRSVNRFVRRNSFQLSYLLNFHSALKINFDNLKTTYIANPYDTQVHGAKFNYTYIRRIKGKVGISVGTEVFWTPSIKYRSNPSYYAPRGGENSFPLFVSLKLGLRISD